MADKSYRSWPRDQVLLLPPQLRQWLPENHLAQFILDIVDDLDLREIHDVYPRKDHRGERPWDPRMLLSLLFYGYATGVCSSRRIEKATYENVASRVIAADTHPDHSCIAEFRRAHLGAIERLFLRVLQLCAQAGMVKLGRVALDGTKVNPGVGQAPASKHKAMSHARVVEREAALRAEIERMLREAEAADAAEDVLHGKDRRGDELPPELRRRVDRLAAIRRARAALEAEAKAAREAELAERARAAEPPENPPAPPSLPSHQVQHDTDGNPRPSAQRNFTDPDSRIMVTGKEFVQAYDAQVVVDEAEQVIVAAAVTNQPTDVQHLPAMVAQCRENLDATPVQLLADAGYWSAANVDGAEAQGIDVLVSVAREKRVLDGGRPWPAGDPRGAMLDRLTEPIGKAAYRRRKAIVEPVSGQIKGARGIRQFQLRGLQGARGEWSLVCTTHNLLKLFRFTQRSALALA